MRVMAALSGGADSLLLARVLLMLREEERALCLSAAHVHHGLRRASDEEEAFVRSFCEAHEIDLYVKRVEVPGHANVEARAREVRYRAFAEAMREAGAEKLALGHHMDDQAETVLMRMMTGAGGTGLSAMREVSGVCWRPMLAVTRRQIRAALRELRQAWREDESNKDPAYRRNAIRLQIMPVLEKISPGSARGMARSALILQDEEDCWQAFVRGWLRQHASTRAPCRFLMTAPCLALHVSARRRVLRGLCETAGIACSFEQVERLLALLASPANSQDNLPGGAHAFRSRNRLHILTKDVSRGSIGQLVSCLALPSIRQEAMRQALDLDAIEGAVLRRRQQGDRISPLGAGGSKPLAEYFTDHLLDRPFRDHWPILAKGQEVLWVPGIGISQKAALTASTARAGLVGYLGRLPDRLDQEQEEGEDSHEGT